MFFEAPLTGIPARLFGEWMRMSDLNNVNDMVEMGFIQAAAGNHISLHPMVQEVALSDLSPGIQECHVMLESIRATCQLHGLNVPYYKLMFQTVENVITLATHNDTAYYLLFLENVFQYMESYRYKKGMELIVSVLAALLSDESIGTTSDRALLLDCRASLEKNPERAIKLIKAALELLPEVNRENELLVSNLNANIGGLYRMTKKYHLAKRYMEAGMEILKQYDLIGYHDSMVQAINYATLLNDMGDAEHGLIGLYSIEAQFKGMAAISGDYATLQQTLGVLNINAGHPDKALDHLNTALSIYGELYADEQELLEGKASRARKHALCYRNADNLCLIANFPMPPVAPKIITFILHSSFIAYIIPGRKNLNKYTKKILILMENPRKKGNTSILCDEFARGAIEAGNTVEKVDVVGRHIAGCLGCNGCQRNGGTCVQKDDMQEIYQRIMSADVVVLASPIYYHTWTSQMKAIIDRTYAMLTTMHNKTFCMISTCMSPDESYCQVMIDSFRTYLACYDETVVEGCYVFGFGTGAPGDVKNTDAMQKAYEMGKTA